MLKTRIKHDDEEGCWKQGLNMMMKKDAENKD